eukprot:1161095-Pelagomonas_calceolata.AAC.6
MLGKRQWQGRAGEQEVDKGMCSRKLDLDMFCDEQKMSGEAVAGEDWKTGGWQGNFQQEDQFHPHLNKH